MLRTVPQSHEIFKSGSLTYKDRLHHQGPSTINRWRMSNPARPYITVDKDKDLKIRIGMIRIRDKDKVRREEGKKSPPKSVVDKPSLLYPHT